MWSILLALLGALSFFEGRAVARQATPLQQGMLIDHSVSIRPGTYRLAASADLKTPALTIRGENIVVDLTGVTLVGSPETADPDEFAGVAILVDGGSRITIRGATIRGYKVGILARNSPDLHLTRNDLSYNWKQRLYSRIEKESLVDWMSYHQNEKDEWLRYGAGIYLSGCDRAEIDHNTVLQGQNGLLVSASTGLKIWNNTFQFLSSLGVGLYRVSGSNVMHNRIDWCVRGYSHGFYNRGQDSAGLLMYEQSSRNIIAYNSVTHGGDGLFLWAGQSTMDTGKGGANDNLFFGNDFSHAPTNGIEATFSRNTFADNRVEENWHGVWGGYSFESKWINNRFIRNTEAIAIEHGQDNLIAGNTFDGNDIGIRLWQNASQDPAWAYPRNRDTRSRGYVIRDNTFRSNKTEFDIRNTADVDRTGAATPTVAVVAAPERMPGGVDPMISDGERRGRRTIVVDEWGPYDWKAPRLWPVLDDAAFKAKPYGGGPVRLSVLGPPGTWKLASARGAAIAPAAGTVPGEVTVTPAAGGLVDWEIALEYRGEPVTSPRGVLTRSGEPYVFRYSRFFAPADWTVRFFEVTDATDPVKQPAAFSRLLTGKPLKTVQTDRIAYLSGGVVEAGVPRDRFALVAETTVDLPKGAFTLQVISDDGARVWVDGRLVLDAWAPHESRVDHVAITGGRRRLKVEYHEESGWSEMRFDIQPRRMRQ